MRAKVEDYIYCSSCVQDALVGLAICFDSIILVPPLKLIVCVEKELSFHRLEPPPNSTNRVCLRHVVSNTLVS